MGRNALGGVFSKNGVERAVGIIDQGLFSVSALMQYFVYAKVLSPDSFGLFALVQGVTLLAIGVQRSAVILPMIMTANEEGGDPAWNRLDVGIRVAFSIILFLPSVAGNLFSIPYEYRIVLALSALCTFFSMCYEFNRRSLFLERNKPAIIKISAVYFLMISFSVAVVSAWFKSLEAALMGYFFAAMISATIARRLRAPIPLSVIRVRDHIGIIWWNLLSFLPYSIYNNGMIIIVGLIADVRSVALFTASRMFTAPIQTLIQAIDSVDKPRARRMFASDGLLGLGRSIKRTRVTLLALGVPYLLVIVLGADLFVPRLFGDRFPGMVEAVQMWAVVALLMMLSQPLETGLLVLHKSNLLFWTRTLAAFGAVVALLGLRVVLPLEAPMVALAVGWAAGGLLAWLLLKMHLSGATQAAHSGR